MKPFERMTPVLDPAVTPEFLAAKFGCTVAEARAKLEAKKHDKLYANDEYQVIVREIEGGPPPLIHLSIRRLDREPIHDWRDLQTIKNMLTDPEFEAVELYPAESRLVDTANQFHLFVFADRTFRMPFGFNQRVVSDDVVGSVKQRARAA